MVVKQILQKLKRSLKDDFFLKKGYTDNCFYMTATLNNKMIIKFKEVKL